MIEVVGSLLKSAAKKSTMRCLFSPRISHCWHCATDSLLLARGSCRRLLKYIMDAVKVFAVK